MKTCFKCKRSLPHDQFYKHAAMADGLLGKCKDCTKADVAVRAVEKRDYISKYEKQRASLPHRIEGRKRYNSSPAGRAAHAGALKRSAEKFPEKAKARIALGNAVRDGRVCRKPCEVCGSDKAEGHHEDYAKPLEVRWLCNTHHREAHRKASIPF